MKNKSVNVLFKSISKLWKIALIIMFFYFFFRCFHFRMLDLENTEHDELLEMQYSTNN